MGNWIENSLSQLEGGEMGRGQVWVEMLWRARTPSGGQNKYVRDKRHCVKVRKGSHGMVEIKLLCFRWLSPCCCWTIVALWLICLLIKWATIFKPSGLWHLVVGWVVADDLKCQEMLVWWYSVTSQKAWIFSSSTVRASVLADGTSYMF